MKAGYIFHFLICVFLYQHTAFTQAPDNPNIIFIILDDLNDFVEGYNGHPQTETPGISTIAENGTTFTRAYCTSPQCGPSRMSMFTGKDGNYTHVYRNTDIICSDFRENFSEETGNAEVITLPQFLKDSAGYFTYGINKVFHCHDKFPDYDSLNTDVCNRNLSWNKLIAFQNGESEVVTLAGHAADVGVSGFNHTPLDNTLEDSMYDYIAIDSAIQFLEKYISDNSVACNKPLFLAVGLRRPHTPLYIPEKYFSEHYFPDFYQQPFNKPYNEPSNTFPYNGVLLAPQPPEGAYYDFTQLPAGGVAQALALETGVHENMMHQAQSYFDALPVIDPAITDEERLSVIEQSIQANAVLAYLAAIKFVDAQIGRLYDYLLQNPEFLNNSIIIIASDNGYSLDEKQHWRKGTLWETDIRIPLIVTDMRNTQQQICDKTVSLLDIYPTLVDILDINPPLFSDGSPYLDGHSFESLLQNPDAHWAHPVLASYRNKEFNEGNCYPQYTVRDNKFHYISYTSNDSVYGQDSVCSTTNNIHEEEFYDVGENYTVDPYEWQNKISEQDYAPAIAYLQQWLPDSVMYLQKAFSSVIQNVSIKCLYERNDTVFLFTELYDEAGNPVVDLSSYTLQWTNNLTADVFTGNAMHFPLSNISDEQYSEKQQITFYVHVYDTSEKNIGFDMQHYFFNPEVNIPNVHFTADMTNGNQTVQITDYTISGAYTSAWWDFGDGTLVFDLIPAQHNYSAPGTYEITQYIQYGNDTSCIKTFSTLITVANPNPQNISLYIYPNPAQEEITFAFNSPQSNIHFEIFDILGSEHYVADIHEEFLIQNSFTVKPDFLKNGQYIARCTTEEGIYSRKFFILR